MEDLFPAVCRDSNIVRFIGARFQLLECLGLSDQLGRIGHLGTWLIVAFFGLLMLTAHAMDKGGTAEKALRLHRCRKQGLFDEDC